MDKGTVKESGSHAELMDIPVKKEADGKTMVSGWYRDLYETQHGKGDDSASAAAAAAKEVEALKLQLETLQSQLNAVQQENRELRQEALEGSRRGESCTRDLFAELSTTPSAALAPPKLSLVRACSARSNDASACPPPLLDLARSSTTGW